MIGETLNIHTSHTFEGHSVASESCGEKSQFRRPDTWFILNRSYPLGYAAKKKYVGKRLQQAETKPISGLLMNMLFHFVLTFLC